MTLMTLMHGWHHATTGEGLVDEPIIIHPDGYIISTIADAFAAEPMSRLPSLLRTRTHIPAPMERFLIQMDNAYPSGNSHWIHQSMGNDSPWKQGHDQWLSDSIASQHPLPYPTVDVSILSKWIQTTRIHVHDTCDI
jgi:hypothetical protein